MTTKNEEIKEVIAQYAIAYNKFEGFQGGSKPFVTGDQKTGVIGEYYAKLYIEYTFNEKIEYEKMGQAYDLKYNDGKEVKVQVKTVSLHSTTKVISKIRLADDICLQLFDKLYLILLDHDFKPIGFWINDFNTLRDKVGSVKYLKSRTIEWPNHQKGSSCFDFTDNLIVKLQEAVKNSSNH